MKKSRFNESQIVSILKQAKSGISVDSLCRDNGISKAIFHNWRSKYGDADVISPFLTPVKNRISLIK